MKTIKEGPETLALTVRKEHRLTTITNKVAMGTIRVSSKAIFAAIVLTVLNMVT